MITDRRRFLKNVSAAAAGIGITSARAWGVDVTDSGRTPVVISTWNHGLPANEAAWEILSGSGYSLDAVEA